MKTDSGLVRAAAFQLLGRLHTYTDLISELAARWPDEQAADRAKALMDVMGAEVLAIPELRVSWVELTISHTELIQQFWAFADTSTRLDAAETHMDVVLSFEAKCLHVATGRPVLP